MLPTALSPFWPWCPASSPSSSTQEFPGAPMNTRSTVPGPAGSCLSGRLAVGRNPGRQGRNAGQGALYNPECESPLTRALSGPVSDPLTACVGPREGQAVLTQQSPRHRSEGSPAPRRTKVPSAWHLLAPKDGVGPRGVGAQK